jgi:hypothetical protein
MAKISAVNNLRIRCNCVSFQDVRLLIVLYVGHKLCLLFQLDKVKLFLGM